MVARGGSGPGTDMSFIGSASLKNAETGSGLV
jgi:hypothetical protein